MSSACKAARRAEAEGASAGGGGVHVLDEELMGSDLASALASCAFDLVPVAGPPSVVQLGSL